MAEGLEPREKSIRVQLFGKRWTVPGKPTKAQIAKVAAERKRIKARVELGEDLDDILAENQGKKPETLGYYAQHFFDIVAPEKVADSTLMGYESAYNAHWLPFDSERIDRIKLTELQRHLAQKEITKKTRKNALSVLKLIYACAVPEIFDRNPLDLWTIPTSKNDKTPEPDPYSNSEREAILSALKKDQLSAWRYFLLAFASGMRTGELLGLPWANYEKPWITISQEMVRREIKHHTKTVERRVILPEAAVQMLAENPSRFQKSLIFLQQNGKPFRDADWLMKHWKIAHQKTGVRLRTGPYPWRSTYISMMLSNGADVYDVARMVGNSEPMIRKHYHKHIPSQTRDDAYRAKIEEIM